MSMKILFILPSLSVGGLEKVQITVANALASRGHDVTVMTLDAGDELKSELSDKVRFVRKPYKRHSIMKKIPYIRNRFYDDGMWEKRAFPRTLYNYYVGKEKYDVLIAFFRGLPIKIISGAPKNAAVKLAWVHNDFKSCVGITGGFKNLKAAKKAYASFDKVVCVSKQAEQSFREVIGVNNTVCIYNSVDAERIRALAKEEGAPEKMRFTVSSVGRLVDAKGYDRLLEATDILNKQGLEFDLWIVGDGAERKSLESIIFERRLTNVKLLGKQLNPYKFIEAADMLVCSSRYEGFNLTVLEALALGKPVLSTNCTGPNEILDGGKFGMIVANSVDGLTEGLKKYIIDKGVFNKYKALSESRAEYFDKDKTTDQIEGLFKK